MLRIATMRQKIDDPNAIVVNTTSHGSGWERDLSPFFLGPCDLYDWRVAMNVENGWQYAKVYADHWDEKAGYPKKEYFEWAGAGWANPKAIRYPMGRGAKPLFSWWDRKKLGYVDARKQIYVPLYAKAVVKTDGFKKLDEMFQQETRDIYLRDFDGYDHVELKLSLSEVLNNPIRKMGHSFVLAMLLQKDEALAQKWVV